MFQIFSINFLVRRREKGENIEESGECDRMNDGNRRWADLLINRKKINRNSFFLINFKNFQMFFLFLFEVFKKIIMMFQEEKKEKSISPNIARSLTSHRISNAIDGVIIHTIDIIIDCKCTSLSNTFFLVRIANSQLCHY